MVERTATNATSRAVHSHIIDIPESSERAKHVTHRKAGIGNIHRFPTYWKLHKCLQEQLYMRIPIFAKYMHLYNPLQAYRSDHEKSRNTWIFPWWRHGNCFVLLAGRKLPIAGIMPHSQQDQPCVVIATAMDDSAYVKRKSIFKSLEALSTYGYKLYRWNLVWWVTWSRLFQIHVSIGTSGFVSMTLFLELPKLIYNTLSIIL